MTSTAHLVDLDAAGLDAAGLEGMDGTKGANRTYVMKARILAKAMA
ncbi:MAG: hypothetical protein AAF559_06160 [Pseudomonadota bacterium]